MIDKEVRGLLPAWALCALAILVSRWNIEPFNYLGIIAYFFGTAALGALSIGQEYAYRTLPSLLSIPIPRRRIWTVKLAVLAPQLAALSLLAAMFVPLELSDQKFGSALFVLPPLVALFVAPWLTMLTRSWIAAVVFTFGVIGGSLAMGDWIGTLRYGASSQVDAFQVAFMWWSLAGVSAVGAVMGWRTFARLQAIEGDADIEIPNVFRRTAGASVTRRHPLLTLIAKELRLQQLAFVIAVLWAVAYTVTEVSGAERVLSPLRLDVTVNLLSVLTAFYTLTLPAVIGSLACAEERNLGTLDSQLLLPISTTTQWVVKSATAVGLAVLLAVVLPTTLARAFHDIVVIAGPASHVTTGAIVLIAGITIGSLYVSTIARSGIRALLGSLGAFAAFGFVFTMEYTRGLGRKVFMAVHSARAAHAHPVIYTRPNVIPHGYEVALQCAFLLLILTFAAANFRNTARRGPVLVTHAVIFAACVVAYDVVMSTIAGLMF